MKENPSIKRIDFDSPSVQSYLTILQSVIARMASNSASCKTWCVTLVSAIIVVVVREDEPLYVWIALIPTLLFFGLDAYYLAYERLFRKQYNAFIQKLHLSTASIDDVFIVNPGAGNRALCWEAICSATSVSVFPFYLVLITLVEVTRRLLA